MRSKVATASGAVRGAGGSANELNAPQRTCASVGSAVAKMTMAIAASGAKLILADSRIGDETMAKSREWAG
jgi:hypothetical protein